jgi:hypothetical protein
MTPHLIDKDFTIELIDFMEYSSFPTIKGAFNTLDSKGWSFLPVRTNRGRCYYDLKIITIPAHAYESKKEGYFAYYVSHEMAHAFAPRGAQHDSSFMAEFKKICPREYQHYEVDYKPKAAMAAGIYHKDVPL